MTDGTEQERPDLEAVLTSLLFCVLSPDGLTGVTEEYMSHLLFNAVGERLIEGLHYGLCPLVPGAVLFMRDWEAQGILRRGPYDAGLSLTPNGVEVLRAKLMSQHYLKYRGGLDRITQRVLSESVEDLLSESVEPEILGRKRRVQGTRLT